MSVTFYSLGPLISITFKGFLCGGAGRVLESETSKRVAPVAQWIERQTPALKAAGSNPAGRTNLKTSKLSQKSANSLPIALLACGND